MPSKGTEEAQHTPGRTSSCCGGMTWGLDCGYIRKGYLWYRPDPPKWIPWCLDIKGKGYYDVSPIRYCPWCGVDLDAP